MPLNFEARVPTYNRPELLRRALESLQAQTYPHWTAMVYDDSSSGEEIVEKIADNRVRYVRNPQRLGAGGNTDQCFSSIAAAGGNYACFLEDDNFLLPEFFSRIASELENRPWPLIQVNQRIWSQARGLHPATETTRGKWFSPGTVDVVHLRAATLFVDGLSNGGVIWKLDGGLNLQVGPDLQLFGLQETCRSLLVKSPFLFVDDPLAVFTYMPKAETARSNEDNRSFGRGQQSIRRFIIERSGMEVVEAAMTLAEKQGLRVSLLELLAHSGYPHLIGSQNMLNRGVLKAYLKGLALRLTQPDPCSAFLAELRMRSTVN